MSRLSKNIIFSLNNVEESEKNRTQILKALSWLKERTITTVTNKMIITDTEIQSEHKQLLEKMHAELQKEEEKLKAIPIPVKVEEEFEETKYEGILGASARPKQQNARNAFEKNKSMSDAKYKAEKRKIDIASKRILDRIEQIKKDIARNEDFETFAKAFVIDDSVQKENEEADLLRIMSTIYGFPNDCLPNSIWPTRMVNAKYNPGKKIRILDKKEKVERFLSLAYAEPEAVEQAVKYNETVNEIVETDAAVKRKMVNLSNLQGMKGILESAEFDLLMDRMKKMTEFSKIIEENTKIKTLAKGNLASKVKGGTYSLMHSKSADDGEVKKANLRLEDEVERHDQLMKKNSKYKAAFRAYTMLALRGEYEKEYEVKSQFTKRCNALRKAGIANDVVAYASFEQKVRAETKNPSAVKSFEAERDFRYNSCMAEVVSLSERKEKLEKSVERQRKVLSPEANEYLSKYTPEELKKAKEFLIDWKSYKPKPKKRIEYSPVGAILTVELLNEMRGKNAQGLLTILKDFEELSKQYNVDQIKETVIKNVGKAREKAKEISKARLKKFMSQERSREDI